MAKKVMNKLKEKLRKKGVKLSVTENGKEGKSMMIASCGFLENVFQQRGRSDFGRQCGNAWSGLENKSQEGWEQKGKGEKEEVQCDVFTYEEELSIPKELHESFCQEVVVSRYDSSNYPESAYSGDVSHGKVKIEKTDGSNSRQKEHNLSVPVHGSVWLGSGRRAYHHGHLGIGQKELGLESGLAGAVMCETRDLGITWPCRHT